MSLDDAHRAHFHAIMHSFALHDFWLRETSHHYLQQPEDKQQPIAMPSPVSALSLAFMKHVAFDQLNSYFRMSSVDIYVILLCPI
ncbi:MAG: hypothetical protein Q9M40_13940 [Sulfurimonas sp.]|nr:hypothetical protein [Sulfurimonas sp.]